MNNSDTLSRLRAYEAAAPEITFEWHDAETGATGFAVINSLRGGAAGGGTRMRKGLDKNEVISLAKTMEIKFSVCGPQIGGAKSGIDFDPADPRKKEVLTRWFKALMPLLKTYYGTGGDLNVDEIHDVIPITESYGLQHPQEGVLIGHQNPDAGQRSALIHQLQQGVSLRLTSETYSPDPARPYSVADMITGWGVAEAARHFYTIWRGEETRGKRAIIQGWGNVAAAAAFYLARQGVRIVGIIDRDGGIIKPEGLGQDEITTLFNTRQGNALSAGNMLSFAEVNEKIWDLEAEIFVPGAASRLVNTTQLERMKRAGMEVISCGANVPFADPEIFMGETARRADALLSVIPDFIANCGMARVFAYLMTPDVSLTDEAIFNDVSETMRRALEELHATHAQETGIMEAGLARSLDKLAKRD